MLSKSQLPHLTEDTVELYAMGRLSEAEIEPVEEHLLVCVQCQDLLTETDEFTRIARLATEELQNEPIQEAWWKKLFSVPKPVFAAVACAALALFVVIPRQTTQTAVVNLQAMRGPEAAAPAPSNAALTLNLSLSGLEIAASPLRVEVADETGQIVVKTDAERASQTQAVAKTGRLSQGKHWVRLYSGDRILREYGLIVR